MTQSSNRHRDSQASPERTIRTSSLTDLAYREIESMILARELEMGERLNDSHLAKRFGISRGPVREAISRLASVGLVEMVRNRGAYVRVIDLEDALEIYEIRAALERASVIHAARRMTPEVLAALRRHTDNMDECERTGDREGYFTTNLDFHRTIHEAAHNQRLRDLCERLARELRLFRHLSLTTAGISESNHEHHQIVDALEAGDIEAAAAAMEDHVMQARLRLIGLAEKLKGKQHTLQSSDA